MFNPSATLDEIDDGLAIIAHLESMDPEDANVAIDQQESALVDWRDHTTGSKRGEILQCWDDLIRDNGDDLGVCLYVGIY